MIKKQSKQDKLLSILIYKNIIASTGASMRLSGIEISDKEVEKIYKKLKITSPKVNNY